jgi:hypothetical protein
MLVKGASFVYKLSGNETWDFVKSLIDTHKIENLTDIISFFLRKQEFQRLQEVLDQYGYKDLGDVQYWHSQDPDDPEPKGLLEWYSAYDDLIWSEIDSIQNKTFEELQNYDPVEVEQRIFEQTKDKLPQEG